MVSDNGSVNLGPKEKAHYLDLAKHQQAKARRLKSTGRKSGCNTERSTYNYNTVPVQAQ